MLNQSTQMKPNVIQNTKENIINMARKLFSERTYLGVSMSDIANKLNITKAALYYHFTGKAEIYKKVLEKVFNELEEEILKATSQVQNPKEKLRQLIIGYLKYGQKEKFLIKSLLLCISKIDLSLKNKVMELRDKLNLSIQQIFEEIFPNKDIKSLVFLFTGIMNGLLLEQSLNNKINLEKAVERVIAVLETESQ
ncbi:MAG: TetR/AcrR family transcriptional regulator [Candidatus Desulfofervidaceae bacterium]|nr:TetR/AcrR family transcriptional regulator [Candidatus Desulfofervidaceae bacterium]